jgi:hypothetical protein
MPLYFESNRGYMKWPYNPESIETSGSRLIVEHEYPHREGAETEDMGRKSLRVDVKGTFLESPDVPSPSPIILINQLFRLWSVGAIGKLTGHMLGEVLEGKLLRLADFKTGKNPGEGGDIPYTVTFIEHYQPKHSKEEAGAGAAGKSSTAGGTAAKSAAGAKPQTRDIVYIVRPNDTLWGIAKEFYKDPLKSKQIMLDNKVDVSDMKPGLRLLLKGVPVHG